MGGVGGVVGCAVQFHSQGAQGALTIAPQPPSSAGLASVNEEQD